MQLFEGRVVLVTGASRGLGRALAIEFARQGADLVISSRNVSANALEQTKRQAEHLGAHVLAVVADISDLADVQRLATEALTHYGRVDVLINNASALGPTPMPYLTDYPVEDFQQVIRTNVEGPFSLTQALIGQMISRNMGAIINVSSDAGVVGYPRWGAYGVSKAALDQLTRTWAAEISGTRVRINSIDPGSMDTDMHRMAEPEEDPSQWARPEEVTDIFIFLASDQAATINGQRLEAETFNRMKLQK